MRTAKIDKRCVRLNALSSLVLAITINFDQFLLLSAFSFRIQVLHFQSNEFAEDTYSHEEQVIRSGALTFSFGYKNVVLFFFIKNFR